MRIEPIPRTAASRERQARAAHARQGDGGDARGDERLPGRARGTALVAIDSRPTSAAGPATPIRPTGPFVTQLLASRMGLAQTRARRRLGAEEASLRYGATDGLAAHPPQGSTAARNI